VSAGHSLTLLATGAAYFPALEQAIDAASAEIRIETYIYIADEIGERISAALMRAAARGVRTHLLVDGIGSRSFVRDHARRLREGGIDVRVFRPDFQLLRIARGRLRRLHRKVAVIDASVAFVGGINIVSDFSPPNQDHPQFDYAVRVEGPVVSSIHANTLRVWDEVLRTPRRRYAAVLRTLAQRTLPPPTEVGTQHAEFLYRDNFLHRRTIERAYLRAMTNAREEIVLTNPYFFPGWRFRRTLKRAARRGVKITLLLQGLTDHTFLKYASRAMYLDLLHAGVRISEYRIAMLHAKACVVDGTWATVGSSNLDPFSLLLAREANLVVTDVAFAQQLRSSIIAAVQHDADPVTLDDWARRALGQRLASWLAYGIARGTLMVARLRGD
jgi:cardiolipin synthase A/B